MKLYEISIDKNSVFENVRMASNYLGAKSGEGAYEVVGIQKEQYELLESYYQEAFDMISDVAKLYLTGVTHTENISKIKMQISSSHNENLFQLIVKECRILIERYMLREWYCIVAPTHVEEQNALIASHTATLQSMLDDRTAPRRAVNRLVEDSAVIEGYVEEDEGGEDTPDSPSADAPGNSEGDSSSEVDEVWGDTSVAPTFLSDEVGLNVVDVLPATAYDHAQTGVTSIYQVITDEDKSKIGSMLKEKYVNKKVVYLVEHNKKMYVDIQCDSLEGMGDNGYVNGRIAFVYPPLIHAKPEAKNFLMSFGDNSYLEKNDYDVKMPVECRYNIITYSLKDMIGESAYEDIKNGVSKYHSIDYVAGDVMYSMYRSKVIENKAVYIKEGNERFEVTYGFTGENQQLEGTPFEFDMPVVSIDGTSYNHVKVTIASSSGSNKTKKYNVSVVVS